MKLIARVMTFAAFAITLLTSKVLAVEMIGLGPVGGGTAFPNNTDVLMIETSPFAVSSLGLAGIPSLSGLDFQPGTGLLFASGGFNDGGNLYTVDTISGAATLIGEIDEFDAVPGLAFDRDGTLFGAAAPADSRPGIDFATTLITIDPATGDASVVGLFGVAAIDSLAVDPTTGILYAQGGNFDDFDELFTVDKSTGVATSLGAITEFGTGKLAPRFIAGLAFDRFGNLFGSVGFGDGRIISIDFSNPEGPTYTILGDARAGSVSDIAVVAYDHFLCYEAEGDDVNATVTLEDQFGVEPEVEVEEPELFCNPVAKTVDGEVTEIGDRTAHLTGYEIERDGEEVKRVVAVANQFGEEQTLTVEEPELLFVPSTKDDPAVDPATLNLDHFKCYEVEEGAPVNVTVTLEDQFGVELQVLVEEPELFCNPVDKNGEGIKHLEAHLTCYEIEDDGEESEREVLVGNQFVEKILEVEKPKLLCVPSEKLSVQQLDNGDEDDDDDDDDDN